MSERTPARKCDWSRGLRRALTGPVLAGLLLMPGRVWAKVAVPAERIPLESLDYQPLPEVVLNSGAAVMTVHFVDATHLLVTFNRRRLLKRLEADPPEDLDRNIDAVLVELPTGKVLARTNWRLHDTGRYLWPLADGRFLLRVRNTLQTFDPMEGLKEGDAFRQRTLVNSQRPIGAVLVSPTADLLILETRERSKGQERRPQHASLDEPDAMPREELVQVDFFRLPEPAAGKPLKAERSGTVAARTMVYLPADSAGWLQAVDQGQAHWAFDFHRHDGKVDELSPYDTTCRPQAMLVSRSEFVAFGCRGGADRRQLGGFNFRGEEMWEQTFVDSFGGIEVSTAAAAGRFALSRLVTTSPLAEEGGLPDAPTAQAVTVFQTETGRQVLNVNPTPVMKMSQNFALSPDGMQLALVNAGAVEVYTLPAPTAKERASVELARTMAPAADAARPIHLGVSGLRSVEESYALRNNPEAVLAATAPVGAVTGVPSVETAARAEEKVVTREPERRVVVMGDPVEDEEHPRRAPTLYGPEDKSEGGGTATGK